MHDLTIPPEQLRAVYLEFAQRHREADELLSKIGDSELMLLKAHLLIEEVLFALLSHKMKSTVPLERARLSFSQLVSLVNGLYDGEDFGGSWLYIACHLLNKLRNRLAHNVKPEGFQEDLAHFVTFVMENDKPKNSPPDSLRFALGSIHGCFSGILAVHKKVALVPEVFGGMTFQTRITLSKVLAHGSS